MRWVHGRGDGTCRPAPSDDRLLSRVRGAPLVLAALLLAPACAHAMHLAEGVLPLPWAAGWTLAMLPFLVLGVRVLRRRSAEDPVFGPFLAMLAAAVFVISCMPVPVPTAGTCSHPVGTGLAAILVGPLLTVLVTVVALLLQALFLAHGGLTTLGADVWSMGVAGGFAGWLVFRGLRGAGASLSVAAFFAGLAADWATYATTAFELASALHGEEGLGRAFGAVALAFVPTQLPLGLLEGVMTAGAVVFIARRRPSLLAFGAARTSVAP
ncbi:energy-coupling factor ABC transporter permease [Pyxidicoccus fallax]|uniref:Cobalt transport protein CbiM n=1 Tax=Pyxidicoccus fallax TaxID=394095 RepID=A0A848LC05_9BACT|nr:energy-coupling factor ABC transporter permease [Pyxidicoccus fallax]NMO16469.1 energy-coupling factor ABC transporter permease [Pyxidicoccus fallax]NPC84240.1 energy-coupling factor ABC transporter permease [Pyxidicoccus fallax]